MELHDDCGPPEINMNKLIRLAGITLAVLPACCGAALAYPMQVLPGSAGYTQSQPFNYIPPSPRPQGFGAPQPLVAQSCGIGGATPGGITGCTVPSWNGWGYDSIRLREAPGIGIYAEPEQNYTRPPTTTPPWPQGPGSESR